MPNSLNPLEEAKRDAQKWWTRLRHMVTDYLKTHTTSALLQLVGGSALAVAVAVYHFPALPWIVCAVVILALLVYAIYATRMLKDQDREARWTYVAARRVQQEELRAKIAMDTVTLTLMGERHAPSRLRSAPPELRAALAFHQHRLREAEARAAAAEAVKEGTATDQQRRSLARLRRQDAVTPPTGPAVAPIEHRRDAHEAKRAALEAEIQALATADDIGQAMQTDEVTGARRTKRERQVAARAADQAARDRVRSGRTPTAESRGNVLNLTTRPNGERDVSQGTAPATPEEIAHGDADRSDPTEPEG